MNTKPEFIGTVDRLPNALCAAFLGWNLNGGYVAKTKKTGVYLRKGDKVIVIYCEGTAIKESYLMNDHGIERFKLFSKQWLLADKKFVESLSDSMCAKFSEVKIHLKNKQYLKVA